MCKHYVWFWMIYDKFLNWSFVFESLIWLTKIKWFSSPPRHGNRDGAETPPHKRRRRWEKPRWPWMLTTECRVILVKRTTDSGPILCYIRWGQSSWIGIHGVFQNAGFQSQLISEEARWLKGNSANVWQHRGGEKMRIGVENFLSYGDWYCEFYQREQIQKWTKRWALGCDNFLSGCAWLLLSKTGPLFSPF